MPNEWPSRPLSEVVSLQRGHDLPAQRRAAGDVPVVGSGGVGGWHNEAKAQGPGVVLGRATNLGVPHWCAGPYWPLNTTLYVTDFRGNDPRFIYHLFESLDLSGFDSGSVQPMLNRNFIAEVPVQLPSLDEQRRIAGVLGALDDLIEVNRGLMRDLYDLALARYAQVMALAKETCRLGDLVTVNGSQIKPAPAGTLTYLDIASVGDGIVQWPTPMPWANAPSRARRLATAGSTIWSTVRPNRRAHALLTHVPDDLVVSTGFAVLEPKVIGSAEIFCATNGDDFVDYLMSRAEGSAYPAVRGSVFEDAAIPYLGSETSARFENFAWPLLLAAGELAEESRQLAATRDELLPLLMSGRVRVGEAGVAA